MKKGLGLVAILLVIIVLLAGGCVKATPKIQPAPVSGVLPAGHQTDFPENLRWLTEEEKEKAIEIALSAPAALEWQQKESQYETSIDWIALNPNPSGEGYSGYRRFEYEVVEEGIPRGSVDVTPPGSPERIVSVGVPEDAEIYPSVNIVFGEPAKFIVSVAVDLKAEKVVYDEGYPFRKGPTLPEKTD